MTFTVARLGRRALAVAVLCVAAVRPAAAQSAYPAPIGDPPKSPQFLPRYDFRLSLANLTGEDRTRFMWDAHYGGDVDFVDYVKGRAGVLIDYQALLGNEYRPFDPNQGNYTLETSGSWRVGRTELAGVFHHVSRHLSDRPKRLAIAMNVLELRILRQFAIDDATIDVKVDGGKLIQHSFVDYTWISSADVTVRKPINSVVSAYGRLAGQVYAVDETIANRGTQRGGRVELGVRLRGTGGAIDFFGGAERVIDGGPLDRLPREWGFVGFRVTH